MAMATNVTERITARLRNDILGGTYKAGERLPAERDLASRLGVNRGSVRETQGEHRAIFDELVRRDPGRARIRMSTHLLGVEQFSAAHAGEDPEAH